MKVYIDEYVDQETGEVRTTDAAVYVGGERVMLITGMGLVSRIRDDDGDVVV